jgi:cell division septum initiation protein DivIVA
VTEPSSNLIRQLTEAITASREVADRRIDALNAAVERTTQNVDRALEGMQQSAERLTDKIDGLADQIRELTKAVNGHLRVAEKQADNIIELTKLVATQANTVATLISRTG